MTKTDVATEAAPRRSTRARTKRPAGSDADDVAEDVPTKKGAAAKAQQIAASNDKPANKRGQRKARPAATTQPDSAEVDLPKHAAKSSCNTKGARDNDGDTAQAASKQATTARQKNAISLKPTASDAAASSAVPVQSSTHQAAAADPTCPKAHTTRVAGDADVMLNQTNIGANNNKFYRMQLLQEGNSAHWLWTRWGRVGDKGQTQLQGPFDADTGFKEFKKKFRYHKLP